MLPDLPERLTIGNRIYRIDADFRRWMEIQQLFLNPDLTQTEQVNIAMINAFGAIPEAFEEALYQLLWFLSCGEDARGPAPPEQLLDWEQDYFALWGDFRVYAGMDIRRVDYLHWWEFMAIFRSLPPDSQIKNRIRIRGIDLNKIKDPETREDYRREKELFSLNPVEDDFYVNLKEHSRLSGVQTVGTERR